MDSEDITKGAARRVENVWVFRPWDYLIFVPLAALNMGVVLLFFAHWVRLRDWRSNPVSIAVMTFLILYNVSIYMFRWFLLPFMKRPRPMPARPGRKVGVATTFVPGAESFEMLEKTVEALAAMRYPHDTWVLDEGDDGRVKTMCARLGVRRFSRKRMPAYHTERGTYQTRSKHGNYNAWFAEFGYDNYEIIVGVDPDHVPYPEFLEELLGYFDDPKIGYVQAAQVYYNQAASFIARGAAEETYAYYSATQMAGYTMGYPIVTGCHQAHRVTALKQVGGFAAHDADDLLITLLYRSAGWQGVYVPKILAKGLTPVDWNGYLAQQFRWARSVLDVKFRAYARHAGNLPLATRIMSLLHGFYYIQEGVINSVGMGLLAVMLATNLRPRFLSYTTAWQLILMFAVFKMCDFYRQRFFLDPRREWGLHWRAGILKAAKWPYFTLALADVMTGYRHRPYVMTLKVKTAAKSRMLARAHMAIVGIMAAAWLTGIVLGHDLHPLVTGCAAATIVVSLALMLTEQWSYPDPFEDRLWRKEFGQ